ncbi:hypothetical protein N665_1793s0009 [Sinapis alba]|nr:hypothetical protein N665_1793s0009 [Sinapis alba]
MDTEKLRDLSKPMDVALLDATVDSFYTTGSKEERAAADNILRDLKANPDTWLQVSHILQNTRSTHTKYFALQVLEGVIKYRWKALPVGQRDGMKNYISEVIVQLSSNEASFRSERLYVNKLNVILVQILKHEWPANWRSFIPDLVNAAKTSETICENCMTILKLLSEEIFDFSRGEMIERKINELKGSLDREFQLIHELCLYVISASQRPELIRATLSALHAYLSWIPPLYIFESPLLEKLLNFFPVPAYRNLTLQCLSKVAALKFGEHYRNQYVQMYMVFMKHLEGLLPSNVNIPEAYPAGSDEEQASLIRANILYFTAFIQNLALFFTSFFKSHINILESTPETIPFLLSGLENLISISYVDDTEVFKMVYLPPTVDSIKPEITTPKILYSDQISKLRGLMITRMAKPEEVLIVEDENGNIVRETMKDSDVLVQYRIMRETLIYLTYFDHDDTERQMLSKLSKQINREEWTWNNLNTLCWAIGSISGCMDVDHEEIFLSRVIRALLSFCEIIKGNDNKAVIASNIMYVVGQFSRSLMGDWEYLMIVVQKLFDFMHETHPGVQDMACDTFLKIVQTCKRMLLVPQVGEEEPFVSKLLTSLTTIIGDLEPHQIHTFYESVACIIQAESDPQKMGEYIERLMALPNQTWAEITGQARQNADILKDPDVVHNVLHILQTNTRVATSLGTHFLSQISLIFLDMLNIYKMYSELVSNNIANGGPYASIVKLLRSVMREILKLIKTFLGKDENQPHIGIHFVPPVMDAVLADYARNVPDARESEVLSLFVIIINQYKVAMQDNVPRIFESVFHCTLEMITKNFEDYPEHRLKFFLLLRAIATSCFPALLQFSSEQLKLVMDSVIWAFRHTEKNIAETGLKLLLVLLKKFKRSDFSNQFHRTYFMQIEQEIIAVMTDTFHKPQFEFHVLVLLRLFTLVESDSLTEPLWDASTVPHQYPNNAAFVCEYTIKLLSSAFPNISVPEDNKDLYAEEAAAAKLERERQRMLLVLGPYCSE